MTTLTESGRVRYRKDGHHLYPEWELAADGTAIGSVWETETGYAGHIEGTTAEGARRQYTCPEKPFRQAVIDRLGEMADRLGIA